MRGKGRKGGRGSSGSVAAAGRRWGGCRWAEEVRRPAGPAACGSRRARSGCPSWATSTCSRRCHTRHSTASPRATARSSTSASVPSARTARTFQESLWKWRPPPPPPSTGRPRSPSRRRRTTTRYSGGGGGGAPLQLHLDSFHASTSPPPSYHRYAHTSTPLFPASGGYGWLSSKEHCLTLGGAADLSLDKPADHHHHDTTSATTTEKPLWRFLDEWPRSDDGRTPWDGTQLSISIPTAAASSPYLAIAGAASRYHNNVTHGAVGQYGEDAWRRLTSIPSRVSTPPHLQDGQPERARREALAAGPAGRRTSSPRRRPPHRRPAAAAEPLEPRTPSLPLPLLSVLAQGRR
uniref:Growth-regulating factor n=1 Tax=Oryza nivara TaxID=4536 RepID=A0A0E0GYV8_ORYNI